MSSWRQEEEEGEGEVKMEDGTHREEGVDDVGLDGAEWFVSDHDEDLLLLLQVNEVTKPRLLSQSEREREDGLECLISKRLGVRSVGVLLTLCGVSWGA